MLEEPQVKTKRNVLQLQFTALTSQEMHSVPSFFYPIKPNIQSEVNVTIGGKIHRFKTQSKLIEFSTLP